MTAPAARTAASSEHRVRVAATTVPLVLVAAGAAISVADIRLGVLAAAVAIGWTQLVGL